MLLHNSADQQHLRQLLQPLLLLLLLLCFSATLTIHSCSWLLCRRCRP
jgi:hypothetical protein